MNNKQFIENNLEYIIKYCRKNYENKTTSLKLNENYIKICDNMLEHLNGGENYYIEKILDEGYVVFIGMEKMILKNKYLNKLKKDLRKKKINDVKYKKTN